MGKREETLLIEQTLEQDTKERRIYGCEEITIGFYNQGLGNEIVDFMTMDSKGIIKCYEIKVTLPDLKSHAKKSFYGHYNYLCLTMELYDKIHESLPDYISNDIGVLVLREDSRGRHYLENRRKARKHDLDNNTLNMLKESMIRSIYFKMVKYKKMADLDEQKELKKKLNKAVKERNEYKNDLHTLNLLIDDFEYYKAYNDNNPNFKFKDLVEDEKKKCLDGLGKS
jgi:hypothetical protein